VTLNTTHLANFSKNFSGVDLAGGCEDPGCLITICGKAPVTLEHAALTGISDELYATVGAVLCAAGEANLTLTGGQLVDNPNAAVLWASESASVSIASCNISGNGGGTALSASGNATLLIVDSIISGNGGSGTSASCTAAPLVASAVGVWEHSVVHIEGSTISNNNEAPAIRVDDTAKLSMGSSTVSGNSVGVGGPTGARKIGAGLTMDNNATVVLYGSTFSGHRGSSAIFVGGGNSSLTIRDSVISDNDADQVLEVSGSELLIVDAAHVNTTLEGNSCDRSGCALHASDNASVQVSNSSFLSNRVSEYGGGGGGAILAAGASSMQLTGCLFHNNSAQLGLGGGALATERDAHVVIEGSRFVENKAIECSGGAALVARGESVVTVTGGSLFSGNVAEGNGGAILVTVQAFVNISGGTQFTNNS
jgi:predicted outer membrane repeat protein